MPFIRKQGYLVSENGWRMCDANELDYGAVPVIGWKVGVRRGDPNYILKSLMVRLHREVEAIDTRQCGVFTGSNSMPNSNHNSGTALDYNWNKHAFHKWGTWANRQALDSVINSYGGVVESGANWTSPRDEMHFELHYAEGHAGTHALAEDIRNGKWGIFGKTQVPLPDRPPVDVPAGVDFWLGIGSNGDLVIKLQTALNKVFPRYKAMPLEVDGDYGPMTASAIAEFQLRDGKAGPVDGEVGPLTKERLAVYGVKL